MVKVGAIQIRKDIIYLQVAIKEKESIAAESIRNRIASKIKEECNNNAIPINLRDKLINFQERYSEQMNNNIHIENIKNIKCPSGGELEIKNNTITCSIHKKNRIIINDKKSK